MLLYVGNQCVVFDFVLMPGPLKTETGCGINHHACNNTGKQELTSGGSAYEHDSVNFLKLRPLKDNNDRTIAWIKTRNIIFSPDE